MKIFKRIVSVLLVISLFIGSFVGSFTLFNNGTYDFDPHYLSVFDGQEDSYYLKTAPSNIKFRVAVTDPDGSLSYTVSDSAGNVVSLKSERLFNNNYNILPPANGYVAGERYTLTLGDGVSFTDENLKNARTLEFCIEREAIEEYTLADTVVEAQNSVVELTENKISVSGIDIQPGEVLFGQNANDEYVAYKIDEILDDGTAIVSIPALDEIYSDLNVYGEYVFDVNDLVTNPDIEVEIIENVKKSSFYSSLITAAYAGDVPEKAELKVWVEPHPDEDAVDIRVYLTLKPGQKGLFGIQELQNHNVIVTLNIRLGLKMQANIQGIKNWDIASVATCIVSCQVEFERILYKESLESGLDGVFTEKDEYSSFNDYYVRKKYQEKVKGIIDALSQTAADAAGGDLKIFNWVLPVPAVPGLYFSAEIKLFLTVEMAASIVVGNEFTCISTVGVRLANSEFTPYANAYTRFHYSDMTLSLRGRASAQAGIKLVINATLVNEGLCNINLDPKIGLYADVFVTIPILNASDATKEKFMYSYFEPGVVVDVSAHALLNIGVEVLKFTDTIYYKKFPIEQWTLGNRKIATGITTNTMSVRAVDNVVRAPEILFSYYDVKYSCNSTETLPYSKLKFTTSDGVQLEEKNGNLTIPAATTAGTGNCYVTATYRHSNDQTYSTVFKVLISGSVLEGKVSAYTDDLATGELSGAKVALYKANDSVTPVSTQMTDENGKFSFAVSEGDYRLVISANGYKTLTSSQHVEKNEIKYTEHILLMDNAQAGIGSAGGKVTNALDGKGVSGVSLKLRRDWNNTSGPYVEGFEATTGSTGLYSVTGVPVGYYTIEASKNGFVTGYSNIIVLSTGAKGDFDFTITPELSSDEIRIVLTWGSSPNDLDSHLIGRTPRDDAFNVYYSNKRYNFDGVEMANLDVDDTSSYGPETITIVNRIYGAYTYAVHNYSNRSSTSSTALSYSGATVKVFAGSTQIAEYHVPTDQVGTYWTVFQISGSGRIMPINTVSNTKPTA